MRRFGNPLAVKTFRCFNCWLRFPITNTVGPVHYTLFNSSQDPWMLVGAELYIPVGMGGLSVN